MLLIGLTGSIATGKSTVSSLLKSEPYQLPIVDADILARKVVEPGTNGYNAIVKHFAPTTPDLLVEPSELMPEDGPDGKGRPLNRPALGKRVFGDSDEVQKDRAVLNGIVHPAVRKEMFKMIMGCYLRGHWAVVLDIPLLFESKLDRFCGTAMVVAVTDPEIQMKRLMARDAHLSRGDAENRVCSQTDVRVKAQRCIARGEGNGVVLWNDGSKEDLVAKLDEAMKKLRRKSPDWWSWLLLGCPPLAVMVSAWTIWQNVRINRRWEEAQKDHSGRDADSS
ncbi:Dephospho-CoA kinase cab5 [Conoideocrella luteorostrata]|uniref:Dephospho-CoA kinase cab5 n=1 Tax=Conoideocrella luteorostrata TaxID=1105319 RepID=A0AAJ0FMD0_9HYPO|nr:Dephospho-CoA kinase cab5 [Conoideocrella luteorostrata]